MSVPRPMVRKGRFTRAQLEQNLQLLKAVIALPMLSATLPVSPSPSRSASPAPSVSGRRKLPQDIDSSEQQISVKRPRTSLQQTDVHQSTSDVRSPHIPQPPSVRKEEVTSLPSTSVAPSAPAPPPSQILAIAPTPGAPEPSSYSHRRGKPSAAEFSRFYDRYLSYGKLLKASAEERMRIVLESEKSRANSTQLSHLSFISRIEAVDGLLNFTYSIWCKDMTEGRCHQSLWDTLERYLQWVRSKWESSETRGDAQRAFLGLIRIIEGYVYARKSTFLNIICSRWASEIEKANKPPQEPNSTSSLSPATSLGGSSQHSASNNSPALVNPTPPPIAPSRTAPHAPAASTSPSGQTLNVPKEYYDTVQASINCSMRSTRNVGIASVYFNLPIIARCFPKTYARILTCQLRYDEEYEVDFDQDECSRQDGASNLDYTPSPGEGPLMWPNPLVTQGVDGLVWVLLLGRAMIREVAYSAGYRGMEGLYRKDAPR